MLRVELQKFIKYAEQHGYTKVDDTIEALVQHADAISKAINCPMKEALHYALYSVE